MFSWQQFIKQKRNLFGVPFHYLNEYVYPSVILLKLVTFTSPSTDFR